VEIRKFLDQYGAKFAEILNRVGPFLPRLTPQFLPAIALIASGAAASTLSSLGIVAGTAVAKTVSKVLDAPTGWAADKIVDRVFGKESSDADEGSRELSSRVATLCEELEKASGGSISSEAGIVQFTEALVGSEQFIALARGMEDFDSKIDALRSEVSVLLLQIEEERKAAAALSIDLPTIQAFLRKGDADAPAFFRPAGPRWVDFEQGYVYQRPVVDDVINRLKDTDIVVLKGNPASGKSVILENIGYRLATEEGADVYYVSLKISPRPETLSEMSKVRHGYIIVDDAHLNVDFVEHLLLIRQNRAVAHAKLIIGSRDVDLEKLYGPTSQLLFPEYLDAAIKVDASDAAGEIASKFNEKRAEEQKSVLPEDLRSTLTTNNLWFLAWQLKSFDRSGKVDGESVLETVKNHLETIGGLVGAENVALLTAVFYEYEIPVRRPFIESFTKSEIVDRLEELSEIVPSMSERRDYVALCHSEVAEIYVRTFELYEDLGRGAKKAILQRYEEYFGKDTSGVTGFASKVFGVYLREFPEESTDILWVLVNRGRFRSTYKRGLKILGEICVRNADDVVVGINLEPRVDRIASSMCTLASENHYSYEPGLLDVSSMAVKIDEEEDVWAISNCLEAINRGSGAAERVFERLNAAKLSTKIERSDDAYLVGKTFWLLADGSEQVAKKTLESLDFARLTNRLWGKRQSLEGLEVCALGLAKASPNAAQRVLEAYFDGVVAYLDQCKDCLGVLRFLKNIARGCRVFAQRVTGALNVARLGGLIEGESLSLIGESMSLIAAINPGTAERIAESLDVGKIVAKTDGGDRVASFADCIGGIADASRSVARRILLALDFGKLDDWFRWNMWTFADLARQMRGISKADMEVAKRIGDGFDVCGLVALLGSERTTWGIMESLQNLSRALPDVAKRVVEALSVPNMVARIAEEGNSRLVDVIAQIDAQVAERLVDGLGPRGLSIAAVDHDAGAPGMTFDEWIFLGWDYRKGGRGL
jgi:hypothetical protein